MADSADVSGRGQGSPLGEDPERSQPLRPGVGTVPGGTDGLEVGPHARGTGSGRVAMEGPGRPMCGLWTTAARSGPALACPPSALALLRGPGDVGQFGVIACQLSPAGPRAETGLMDQAASCEGRCERLEPYEARSFTYGCASRKGWCVPQESVLPG